MKKSAKCETCNSEFIIKPHTSGKYCCRSCSHQNQPNFRTTKSCIICEKLFIYKRYREIENPRFCSIQCKGISSRGISHNTNFYDTASEEEKFLKLKTLYESKVIKRTAEECWGWTHKTDNGYGRFTFNRKSMIASRASYIIHKGNIPDGLWVLHICDNPICTNPNHLYLGNVKDNVRDALDRKRWNPPRGNSHHNAILTDKKVTQIKQMLADEIDGGIISRKFKISPMTLSDIRLNKTWKHIK